MPKKGKLPEWEREENRKKIFLTLLKDPLTFTELLKTLPISRGTLAGHLKDLEEANIIERTRRKGKRVYQVIFGDEEKIMDEIKSAHFDLLLKILSDFTDPLIFDIWKSYSECLLRGIIYFKRRELMGEPRLSAKELHIKSFEIMKAADTPSLQKLFHVDEILERLREMPESEFSEIEELRRSVEKGLRKGKKDEVKN